MSSKRIGLTGGPGCGKSAASDFFKSDPSWLCLDADQVCHEIYEEADSPWVHKLADRWGPEILQANGKPDRKQISIKVFSDERERQWLNAELHPEIIQRMLAEAEKTDAPFVLMEIPLLFESGWQKYVDKVIAVWSSPEIQMQRLLQRGWNQKHAKQRIMSQLSAAQKLEMSDFGIINCSTLQCLQEQCMKINEEIKKLFL